MYTGYYARYKHYLANELIPISISTNLPYWIADMKSYSILSPGRFSVEQYKLGIATRAEHEKRFKEYLSTLDKELVLRDIYLLAHDLPNDTKLHKLENSDFKDIILCCYEKPLDYCHRHLVAEWLSDIIKVEEYPFENYTKITKKKKM